MNKVEAKKLLASISLAYPSYQIADIELASNLWADMLSDYTYSQANAGLRAYITSDTSGFAPSIGQLIGKIQAISTPQELDDMTAWGLVSKAIRNGTYGAVEEYNKLPPLVQKAVGMPDNLKNWATADYGTIETVIQSNFLRTYRTIVKRESEYDRMPSNIKTLIEDTNKTSYNAQIEQKYQKGINLPISNKNSNMGKIDTIEGHDITSDEIANLIKQLADSITKK